MTPPITRAREKIMLAMLKAKHPFSSQRSVAIAAGLVDADTLRNSARMRVGQRAIVRLVKAGLVRQSISSAEFTTVEMLLLRNLRNVVHESLRIFSDEISMTN